jgi:CxxC motif-containing protein
MVSVQTHTGRWGNQLIRKVQEGEKENIHVKTKKPIPSLLHLQYKNRKRLFICYLFMHFRKSLAV